MRDVTGQKLIDRGIGHHRAGRLLEAVSCYRTSLCWDPADSDACNNAGIALRHLGGFELSLRLFRQGLSLSPDRASLHGNLGNLLRDANQMALSVYHFKAAIALDPAYLDGFNNLANLEVGLALLEEAERHYHIALRLEGRPRAAILSNYLELLEKANRIGKAVEILQAVDPESLRTYPAIALTAAKIKLRNRDPNGALAMLEGIELAGASSAIRADFWSTKGRAQEALELYPQALRSHAEAKAPIAEEYVRRGVDSGLFVRQIVREQQLFMTEAIVTPPTGVDASPLVFLVGFPRSGTTLLDTILHSHGAFTVLEELPLLETALAPFFAVADSSAASLPAIRDRYLKALEPYREQGKALVDKMPLNIAHAGMIKTLFPDAKIICALRDPRDAVLSGYLQHFTPNEGMASFLTLEGGVELYDTLFRLWEFYRRTLAIDYIYVRYEAVVEDFDAEIGRLLAYLGVPWRDEVRDFHQTATGRGVIATPSYHQVVQPIYRGSIGRWKHYAPYLGDAFAALEKWVDAFGYR